MTKDTLNEISKALILQEEIISEYERLENKFTENGKLTDEEWGQWKLLEHLKKMI
jgi:hypothetical protein